MTTENIEKIMKMTHEGLNFEELSDLLRQLFVEGVDRLERDTQFSLSKQLFGLLKTDADVLDQCENTFKKCVEGLTLDQVSIDDLNKISNKGRKRVERGEIVEKHVLEQIGAYACNIKIELPDEGCSTEVDGVCRKLKDDKISNLIKSGIKVQEVKKDGTLIGYAMTYTYQGTTSSGDTSSADKGDDVLPCVQFWLNTLGLKPLDFSGSKEFIKGIARFFRSKGEEGMRALQLFAYALYGAPDKVRRLSPLVDEIIRLNKPRKTKKKGKKKFKIQPHHMLVEIKASHSAIDDAIKQILWKHEVLFPTSSVQVVEEEAVAAPSS